MRRTPSHPAISAPCRCPAGQQVRAPPNVALAGGGARCSRSTEAASAVSAATGGFGTPREAELEPFHSRGGWRTAINGEVAAPGAAGDVLGMGVRSDDVDEPAGDQARREESADDLAAGAGAYRVRCAGEEAGPSSPARVGTKTMRSGAMPQPSRRSAVAPKVLQERPGPSSTITKVPEWATRRSRSRRETRRVRRNGWPPGRKVSAGQWRQAATAAARLVPMLRRPMTSGASARTVAA